MFELPWDAVWMAYQHHKYNTNKNITCQRGHYICLNYLIETRLVSTNPTQQNLQNYIYRKSMAEEMHCLQDDVY